MIITNMVYSNLTTLIILNINGLNTLIKRQRMDKRQT